jgi:4-diphosphocytidyl-2-C-methyl-D-erythritol kinase
VTGVRVEAPAKINLRLVVLARETSGYHSLETLFCAVSLCDRIEIGPAEAGITLEVEGQVDTGAPEHNLVMRAAQKFYAETGMEPSIHIRLEKKIPSAAGLGGGSSDAAATLRALNSLHGHLIDSASLAGWGSALGSDVPFFLCDSPYAFAWGRGERLLSLPPPPMRSVLIAHPGFAMPTSEVFARFAELRLADPQRVSAFVADPYGLSSWPVISNLARNDLESAVMVDHPDIQRAKDILLQSGASLALLSGSGASVFGIFNDPEGLEVANRGLREIGFSTWVSNTLKRWPEAHSGIDPRSRKR